MKKLLLALLAALLVAANPPSWSEAAAPFRIAGPLYSVGTRGLAVYLLETSEGLILLSGATPGTDGLIVSAVEKLGFEPRDVKLILS